MSLPPALAARLKQRGILRPVSSERVIEEEVIAEDYDEQNIKSTTLNYRKSKAPVIGCPNKYNIHHECSEWCQKRWGNGQINPPAECTRKYQKLMKKYPLSEEWTEVWDPGVGVYYFWNTVTDEVCWLPPSHPKAVITQSAAKIRVSMNQETTEKSSSLNFSSDEDKESDDEDEEDDEEDEDEDDDEEDDNDTIEQPISFGTPSKPIAHSSRSLNYSKREKIKRNDLDPMDPASYSDTCPRGKWSDGLEAQTEKTGADPTAAGPLYQMRPYPNPGDVLKMNKRRKSSE